MKKPLSCLLFRHAHYGVLLAVLMAAPGLPMQASAANALLPAGGQFVAGTGSIASSSGAMTVNQSSARGIINWQSFSIGAGNSVQFNNGSGATLNRVAGGSLSQIMGTLSATGSVYLINPQGVVVGKGGVVTTGGSFVASTRDITDADFMAGTNHFVGSSDGNVVNQGSITSANGDVVLVGASVRNDGEISAADGAAELLVGNDVLLQPGGDAGSNIYISGGTGDVTNSGSIKAAQAALNAAGGNVYALAGNTDGIISATGTTTRDGQVWLTAGNDADIEGTITAKNADGSGGAVEATAKGSLTASGTIDVSAAAGSDRNGGSVRIMSGATSVDGTILARAGDQGGDGGQIETSGNTLDFDGITVDASAKAGKAGAWLLDPYDLTVGVAGAAAIMVALNSGDVELQTTSNAVSGTGISVAGTGVLNPSGSGDIIIASPITWSNNTLTLDAYHSVLVNADLTATSSSAGLSIVFNDTAANGTGAAYAYGSTDGSLFTRTGNSISFASTSSPLSINGASYTLIDTPAALQGISLSGNYALANDIDLSGIPNFTPLTGDSGAFDGLGHTLSNLRINVDDAPISNPGAGLLGLFTGIGATGTIRNLTVNGNVTGDTDDYVGLLAGENNGTILNAHTAGSVSSLGSTGSFDIGGLVGENYGTIADSSSSAAVSGRGAVGGLVGKNEIVSIYAGSVGIISNSYATGPVSAGDNAVAVGGLVGESTFGGAVSNLAPIINSYATGSVSVGNGSTYIGGLVGYGLFATTNSYATGAVSAGDNAQYVGGFTGYSDYGSSIVNSYSLSDVRAGNGAQQIGGFIGYSGNATFAGESGGAITASYAAGRVSTGSGTDVGGFAGANLGTVLGSYWDVTASGQTSGCGSDATCGGGATGLTTTQWFTQGPQATGAAGWDFSNSWVAGYPYPVLKTLPYAVVTGSGTKTAGDPGTSLSAGIASIADQNGVDASAFVNAGSLSWFSDVTAGENVGDGPFLLGGKGALWTGEAPSQIAYRGLLSIIAGPPPPNRAPSRASADILSRLLGPWPFNTAASEFSGRPALLMTAGMWRDVLGGQNGSEQNPTSHLWDDASWGEPAAPSKLGRSAYTINADNLLADGAR